MSDSFSNISAIRLRLGDPDPSAPSDLHLLNLLIAQLSHHHAQLQNTRNHWNVNNVLLSVTAGQEDYVLNASDFGRPFLVYTVSSTDPFHVRREIPFSLLQDADQLYQGPQQAYSTFQWTAVEMCFYRQTNVWKVRPVPIPNAAGDYQVWYEQNYVFSSLNDETGLSSFHHLVQVQTAISALPLCEWGEAAPTRNSAAWEMKVRVFRDALTHDEKIYQREFDKYKAQASREGVSTKLGYASDYEDEGMYAGRMISGWGI